MPLRHWMRSHAAVRLLLPMVVLSYLLLGSGYLDSLGDTWYQASAAVAASALVIAPLGGALAAWEAARLRSGGIFETPSVRSPARIAGWSLGPVLVACLLSLLVVLGVAAVHTREVPGTPSAAVISLPIMAIAAFAGMGFALGMRVRPLIAVPALLIGGFVVLGYPVAMEPLWLRHLVGLRIECCGVDEVPNPRVIIAPLLVFGSLLLASLVGVVVTRPSRITRAVMTVLLCMGVSGAVLLVHRLDWRATLPRTEGLACERSGSLDVCLWSENERFRTAMAPVITSTVERLTGAGLDRPGKVTEGKADRIRSWQVVITSRSTPTDVVASLALGLMPPAPECATRGPWPGGSAGDATAAWLILQAGIPAGDLAGRLPAEGIQTAQRVRELQRDEQKAWLMQNLQALGDCVNTPARLGPNP